MDNIREVVKRIKRVAIFDDGKVIFRRGDKLYDDLDTVIELSSRLEPKKPVIRFDYVGDVFPNKCPNCDHNLVGQLYCPYCGQALDWR